MVTLIRWTISFKVRLIGGNIKQNIVASQLRKEDPGCSIVTCPAHTSDVREDRMPCDAKWKTVPIDELRLPTVNQISTVYTHCVQHKNIFSVIIGCVCSSTVPVLCC